MFAMLSGVTVKRETFGAVYVVKLVGNGGVTAGQVQEQLQQLIFEKGDLNTGQPGYQFWKARGSPLAQRDQAIPVSLVKSYEGKKYLRRPIQ